MNEQAVCPYCKGSLFIGNGYIEKIVSGKKALYPYARPCYCEVNRQIGVRFPALGALPDIPPKDAVVAFKNYRDQNILFHGKETDFLYIVKSFFMNEWNTRDYIIHEGMEIVQEYHVPKKDGTWRTISTLNQYDLLALLFTSYTHYDTLQNCVLDIIKNRLRLEKPTWLYAKDDNELQNAKEFSSDLKPFLERFRKVTLGNASMSRFEGTVEIDVEKSMKKRQRNINEDLGS